MMEMERCVQRLAHAMPMSLLSSQLRETLHMLSEYMYGHDFTTTANLLTTAYLIRGRVFPVMSNCQLMILARA